MIRQIENVLLVILFKETISSSSTIRSLLLCDTIEHDTILLLWDNSPEEMSLQEFNILKTKNINYIYTHSKENKSLSKIYNETIEQFKTRASKIFIFDQDSVITERYFELVKSAFNNHNDISLFLPYVSHNGKIISPNQYKVFINYNYFKRKSLGRVDARGAIAFGSGICLRASSFETLKLRFDEELNFYGVDYKFVLDYGDVFNYFFVIDYALEHDLSLNKVEDVEIKKRRFNSNCFANLYLAFSRLNIFYRIFSIVRLLIDTTRFALRYRSIYFFGIFYVNLRKFLIKKTFNNDNER